MRLNWTTLGLICGNNVIASVRYCLSEGRKSNERNQEAGESRGRKYQLPICVGPSPFVRSVGLYYHVYHVVLPSHMVWCLSCRLFTLLYSNNELNRLRTAESFAKPFRMIGNTTLVFAKSVSVQCYISTMTVLVLFSVEGLGDVGLS